MKFFSRELCEKLHGMGCKSESGFYYFRYGSGPDDYRENPLAVDYVSARHRQAELKAGNAIMAFGQNDFTGCHDQARENARIVWGKKLIDTCWSWGDSDQRPEWEERRHEMIDAPDAEKYLEETMR